MSTSQSSVPSVLTIRHHRFGPNARAIQGCHRGKGEGIIPSEGLRR